jgi:cystathionine beta-lyase
MLSYVEGNVQFVEQFCAEHMPAIKPVRPQASFLVWLDCTSLQLNHEQLLDLFINRAHLALNDGEMFGSGGEGHMRLNVGEPRSIVQRGLEQLAEAVNSL